MRKRTELGSLTFYGSKNECMLAESVLLSQIDDLLVLPEKEVRVKIQKVMDEYKLQARILINGNSVWSFNKIISNVNRILKHGTLGNAEYLPIGSMLRVPEHRGKPVLSDYFYEFLHLHCGSIAHYNKAGWIATYPSVNDLRDFFRKNEFGKRVLTELPSWMTDVQRIVQEIEVLLGV